MKKKTIVIFGLGSIGLRYADMLSKISGLELLAFRSGCHTGKNNLGIEEIRTWTEVASAAPFAAVIANPTYLHVETALKAAKLGIHLFIEKPLSSDLRGLARLKKICQTKHLTCYMAYCLRFHPVIKKVRELLLNKQPQHVQVVCSSFLPDWRGGKETYSSFRNQGGGVLLDLSHELDYVGYLFGPISKITGVFGKAGNVTRDSEDYADLLIKARNAIPVSVHLDYLSQNNERNLKIAFDGGYLYGDLLENRLTYYYQGKKKVFRFKTDRNIYLAEQFKYFLDNIGNPLIMNNLAESGKLLEMILELKNG